MWSFSGGYILENWPLKDSSMIPSATWATSWPWWFAVFFRGSPCRELSYPYRLSFKGFLPLLPIDLAGNLGFLDHGNPLRYGFWKQNSIQHTHTLGMWWTHRNWRLTAKVLTNDGWKTAFLLVSQIFSSIYSGGKLLPGQPLIIHNFRCLKWSTHRVLTYVSCM